MYFVNHSLSTIVSGKATSRIAVRDLSLISMPSGVEVCPLSDLIQIKARISVDADKIVPYDVKHGATLIPSEDIEDLFEDPLKYAFLFFSQYFKGERGVGERRGRDFKLFDWYTEDWKMTFHTPYIPRASREVGSLILSDIWVDHPKGNEVSKSIDFRTFTLQAANEYFERTLTFPANSAMVVTRGLDCLEDIVHLKNARDSIHGKYLREAGLGVCAQLDIKNEAQLIVFTQAD